jgi:hypothetical protein
LAGKHPISHTTPSRFSRRHNSDAQSAYNPREAVQINRATSFLGRFEITAGF